MRRAVFLDRDDTLIVANALPPPPPPAARGDVVDPATVQLLPGVSDACRRLTEAGWTLVVVTNQGGVARGGVSIEGVQRVNDRLRELLHPYLEAFYFCPFHPKGNDPRFAHEHPWRKPAGGMVTAAAAELGLDLESAWLVGDKQRDAESGIAAGLAPSRCLWIGADRPVKDMAGAADVILADDQQSPAATDAALPQGAAPHSAPVVSIMRLRALRGEPLADAKVRAMVLSTAAAIAERTGVPLIGVQADDASVTVTVGADRLVGVGFMAELRRVTNAWWSGKNAGRAGDAASESLWGDAGPSRGFDFE